MRHRFSPFNILIAIISGLLLNSCGIAYSPRKLNARAEHKKPYDVIIVPGYPYDSTVGKWNDLVKARVYWSHYLYKKGIAKNVIYSGSAVYTPYVEAKVMALYGEALGIPKENIYVEDRAEHSTENIYYSYFLAKRLGFEKIAVASDPVQSRLTRRFPKKMKLKVDYIPIVFDTLRSIDMKDPYIDAEKAKVKNFVSIVERESTWKRFKGTLGKNLVVDPLATQNH